MKENKKSNVSRRSFLRGGARGVCLLALGGAAGITAGRLQARESVWQIDPSMCVACGNCATYCVQKVSAVKCVHAYDMCGYCEICTGFLDPDARAIDTAAENQLCPTGAIIRTFLEDPYYEYTIDEPLCVGCGKCVKGCKAFGNGSLFLQVRHHICLNCNSCSIAAACPSGAFQRIPASRAYLLKGRRISE